MAQWNWEQQTWTCEQESCGHRDNLALANFCAACGVPLEEKSTNCSASIPIGEGDEPKRRNLILRNADLLLNIFGVALIIDRSTGKMACYPDPFLEGRTFGIPAVPPNKGLQQVVFDRWCVYALDTEGRVWAYPIPALSDETMVQKTAWRVWCEGAERILVYQEYLVTVSGSGRRIQAWKVDAGYYSLFWPAQAQWVPDPTHVFDGLPFRVEQVVPMRGRGFLLGLIGQQEVALFSTERRVHGHDQTFRPEGSRDWTGANRGLPKLAAVRPGGEIFILSFMADMNRTFQEGLGSDPQGVVHCIEVEGAECFLVITSGGLQLIDPLDVQARVSNSSVLRTPNHREHTQHSHLYSSFGNLAAGFQVDQAGQTLFSVFSAERNGRIQRRRFWAMDAGLRPVAPPAGFGRRLYLLCRSHNTLRLVCYDLRTIRSSAQA